MSVWSDIFNGPLLWLLLVYVGILLVAARFFIRDARTMGSDHANFERWIDYWRNK